MPRIKNCKFIEFFSNIFFHCFGKNCSFCLIKNLQVGLISVEITNTRPSVKTSSKSIQNESQIKFSAMTKMNLYSKYLHPLKMWMVKVN